MSKLLAYRVSGSTFNWNDGSTSNWSKIVGVELESFDEKILNNVPPYKFIGDNDPIPAGYVDITSIYNLATFGTGLELDFSEIRNEIKRLVPSELSGLTEQEIQILDFYGLTDYYIIYDFLKFSYPFNPKTAPIEVDYDLGGLFKKRTFNKGELITVEYYGMYVPSSSTYSELVVKEDRVYYRINQMLNRREMNIKWYLSDGTIGHEKNTVKYYTMQEAIDAGIIRRNNIVSKLKIDVVGLLMVSSGISSIEAQNVGRVFLDDYYVEIGKYVEGYEDIIKTSIQNDTKFTWLDLVIPNTGGITIRQYLLSELTIDYTINNVYV